MVLMVIGSQGRMFTRRSKFPVEMSEQVSTPTKPTSVVRAIVCGDARPVSVHWQRCVRFAEGGFQKEGPLLKSSSQALGSAVQADRRWSPLQRTHLPSLTAFQMRERRESGFHFVVTSSLMPPFFCGKDVGRSSNLIFSGDNFGLFPAF